MSPYRIPALAGKPYRPSNGTEGMMFMEKFCDRCQRDALYRKTGWDGCEIIDASLVDGAKEWTHDAEGRPTCTEFEKEDER